MAPTRLQGYRTALLAMGLFATSVSALAAFDLVDHPKTGYLFIPIVLSFVGLAVRFWHEAGVVNASRLETHRLLEAERAARGEAERSARLKDEFLATLSHELRTPLNAILGWSHLLRAGDLEPEEVEQAHEAIERNAQAQTRIIEDLLDMSKITQGKFHIDIQDIDLAQVVGSAVQAVQPSCKSKGVQLECLLPPAVPTRGDGVRLQQVVWNLLSNAIKFSEPEGRIEVKLSIEEEQLVLSVRDYGAGIDPKFLPHLFEKFRQQDGSSTRGARGMGLGLSIVRQILEFHAGSVRAHSDGLGQGSLFTVQLPNLSSAPEGDRVVKLPGVKILVVEDDPDARDFLVRLLRDRDADVTGTGSVDEALSSIERQVPDLLISDIGMPGKDGYQLIREVRTRPDCAALPAIAVTAFTRKEDREAALSAGYQRHITKPINAGRLLMAAHNLTSKGQS
ncbi:MAG: response regulator [Candidatus Eremiobacteraeota bacterium]|nr:response regulator [Candidatus Eremiobacteraeota bacterium]